MLKDIRWANIVVFVIMAAAVLVSYAMTTSPWPVLALGALWIWANKAG